ncbi:MAG: ferritin-like domain-containing protein [Lachnospiraceae bacterium]|nr:ferritin-like domain-containing protein [Lachnospiraceae bacterium]
MRLKEKEKTAIKDLCTQEEACVEKYRRYAKEAKDPVLKELCTNIMKKEEKHLESLNQILAGTCPTCDVNDSEGEQYNPQATYDAKTESKEKKADNFLVTDLIGTEKLVSGEYNTNVFIFADACIRKLLADIQVEEQNHAEMLYKYKTVNGMA